MREKTDISFSQSKSYRVCLYQFDKIQYDNIGGIIWAQLNYDHCDRSTNTTAATQL
jgi:hypothetical protein